MKTDSQLSHVVSKPRPAYAAAEPLIREISAAVSEESKPMARCLDLIPEREWKRFEGACQHYHQLKGSGAKPRP